MENIIKKAIEVGYRGHAIFADPEGHYLLNKEYPLEKIILDPTFWQALENVCKWEMNCNDHRYAWEHYALRFHQINLTESWESAIKYLEDLLALPEVK